MRFGLLFLLYESSKTGLKKFKKNFLRLMLAEILRKNQKINKILTFCDLSVFAFYNE